MHKNIKHIDFGAGTYHGNFGIHSHGIISMPPLFYHEVQLIQVNQLACLLHLPCSRPIPYRMKFFLDSIVQYNKIIDSKKNELATNEPINSYTHIIVIALTRMMMIHIYLAPID